MESLKRTVRGLLLVLVAAIALTGCSGGVPAVDTFDAFKEHINSQDFGKAHQMLTSSTQSQISQEELKELCTGELSLAFTDGQVKNPRWVGGEESQQTGEVQIFNDDGAVERDFGTWTVVKEGDDWRVLWTLSSGSGSGVGTGGEDPTSNLSGNEE